MRNIWSLQLFMEECNRRSDCQPHNDNCRSADSQIEPKRIVDEVTRWKAAARSYLLEESCVATWMVSNVHMTIMNGMITWKNKGQVINAHGGKGADTQPRVFKIRYLPHHQPSHDEGVEDGEETINRRWVETGKNEKEAAVTTDNWRTDVSFNQLE